MIATATHTSTRTEILANQAEYPCLRLLRNGGEKFDRLVLPALQDEAIHALRFFGVTLDGQAKIKLEMEFDWSLHHSLKTSKLQLFESESWADYAAPSTRKAVQIFADAVKRFGLKTKPFIIPVEGRPLHPTLQDLSRSPVPIVVPVKEANCHVELMPEVKISMAYSGKAHHETSHHETVFLLDDETIEGGDHR
jgi:hypothetical protein